MDFQNIPRFSKTLAGANMEPVNLVLIGNRGSINKAFSGAGWYKANRLNPFRLFFGLLAIIFDRPYSHGPVTPLFVNRKLQNLAFQKPTPNESFRRRHHVRIWKMADNFWVASACYDDGIRFTWRPLFITHSVNAHIDAEREFVVKELTNSGSKFRQYFPAEDAYGGKNAYGDRYDTDGQIAVVELS